VHHAGRTAAFLKGRTGIIPGEELLDKIILHTEGWPAGIVLICQMLGGSSTGEAVGILDRSDRKEVLFQYIAAEVLRSVDDNLLRFLVKTAILPEFTVAAAAEIFNEKKALQLLEKCMHKGLFIQKIFGSDMIYRFHSLFREALTAIQPQYLNGEGVKDYHLKAAVFYIKNQAYDRAIEHFIDCGNVDLAVDLVIRVARERVNLLAFETIDQLRLWFKLLPEKVVNNNGYLPYIKSFITFPKRPSDAIQLLERALEVFRQSDDRLMQLHALISMSQIYIERNDVKELEKLRRRAYALSKGEQGQPMRIAASETSIWRRAG
jgi:ATP/maltotriose-dependent transcriptional regulator MalT